ncbi:MAG TPA: type II toxin-antitoxin system RelE/ParE family toxin [Pirellulales bacterium]|jgi:mRNA interferase RelE/StbE|nr:type II toxin-antitoxin system RelE/ParE family toxin [Pirellulales bacterium]
MHVTVSPLAQDQLEKLPTRMVARVWRLLDRLKNWPKVSGAKRLTGELEGLFRMRTGDYRIIFRVVGETIVVEAIGHRKDIYE